MTRSTCYLLILGTASVLGLATEGRAQGRLSRFGSGNNYNPYGTRQPVSPYYNQPAPAPVAGPRTDLNVLSHAMAQRVRHLGEDVAADLGGSPQANHLVEDTQELALTVDQFHETLHDLRDPNQLRQAYAGIDQSWHHLKTMLAEPGFSTPAINQAALRVDQVAQQLRQAIGLDHVVQRPVPGGGPGPIVQGPPSVEPLAGQLVGQVNAFFQAFAPRVDVVPQGERFLVDIRRLQAAAIDFQRDCQRGLPPNQLAAEFQTVEASWARLEGRIDRIAQGRTGPNIELAHQMGATCQQIEQTLSVSAGPPLPGPLDRRSLPVLSNSQPLPGYYGPQQGNGVYYNRGYDQGHHHDH